MRIPWANRLWIMLLLALAGCASSDVTQRRSNAADEYIAKPGRILVHSFAATPKDLPSDSVIKDVYTKRDQAQSPEEIELGRKLGDQVADDLVEEILEMGMPAERAEGGPGPNQGDLVIKGVFVSVDEGSRLKRMIIGFGAGSAELKTLVEGYQVTPTGLRALGSAEFEAAGGKMPGMLVPVGAGALAGKAATSAAVSGTLNVAQEFGPESIGGAAERTAESIAEVLREAFEKRGWIE